MNYISVRRNFQEYQLCTGIRLFLKRYVSDRNPQSDQATGWTTRPSIPNKDKRFLLFLQTSRSALVPTQPPIKWVSGLTPRVKWQGSEADHSPLPSAVVKDEWNCNSPLPTCLRGVDRETFTFCMSSEIS